jgi:hypothetical protein
MAPPAGHISSLRGSIGRFNRASRAEPRTSSAKCHFWRLAEGQQAVKAERNVVQESLAVTD